MFDKIMRMFFVHDDYDSAVISKIKIIDNSEEAKAKASKLEEKRNKAKQYLGNKWILHPENAVGRK